MKTDASNGGAQSFYLPNACESRAAFAIVVIVQLTALVLALARQSNVGFWTDLGRTSLFLLWIGLAGAAVLCWAGPALRRMTVARGSIAVLAIVVFLISLVSVCTFALGRTTWSHDSGTWALFPADGWGFWARNVSIGAIVTALALRYFYVTHQWRLNVEMQAAARVHALQARIRPHFLFNSMNTIASLTRTDPARAEQAVQDLADLFRANLSEKRNIITLEEELEVGRTYQRIEQLRLGSRLRISWNIDPLPRNALVPGLMLQPLLENAIYHGIEPQPGGGTVTVVGELNSGLITIVVRNPVTQHESEREGNRLALANIRERLTLMYGERGLVKSGRFDSEYIVTLRFPHIESRERLSAGEPANLAVP
jgi:two-component system, LytTR family, sensor histidine kinase AlgZ